MAIRNSVRVASLILLILTIVRTSRAEVTDDQARAAIDRGVKFLLAQQKSKGNWDEVSGAAAPGTSALATLALLNSGVDPKSAPIQKALNHLRSVGNPENTYGTSLQTMVFCIADPNKFRSEIARNVQWLEKSQLRTGPRIGAWGYGLNRSNGDNSNAQFALLGLYEAERVGVKVNPETFKAALDYWVSKQNQDGSWNYMGNEPGTGSMTCAGIASVIICSGRAESRDAQVTGDKIECCGSQANNDSVERGLQWLGKHFSA